VTEEAPHANLCHVVYCFLITSNLVNSKTSTTGGHIFSLIKNST